MKRILEIKYWLPVLMFSLLGAYNTHAQKSAKSSPITETVVLMTSAQCDMCKARIEGKLGESKGVRMVALDIRSKKLTVKYNPEKTTVDEIKRAVAALGYDADEAKGDPTAHKNLPTCCQKH